MSTQMPYLRAIQEIPGDNPSEKLKWIAELNPDQRQASGDLDRLPPELWSILRVQTAIKKKRHEDITWALKSTDLMIVNKAFKASWFYDGSHKDIVDVAYYFKYIFPYVSYNTRTRLVNILACRLTGKDPTFARQMFEAIMNTYGLEQALPLIAAFDEAFAYDTIVKYQIALPYRITAMIFRRNPDFVVRYLRLSEPIDDERMKAERNPFRVNINNYVSLLPKLIKKRLKAFIELYEMHEKQPPCITLSNKRAEILLKKGLEYVKKKPRLYINILPLKRINVDLMASILPNLLPEKIIYFRVNDTLKYLAHCPDDQKVSLLCTSYKDKYGVELLDDISNLTPELMRILPPDERVKQAERNIASNTDDSARGSKRDYEKAWVCYLPTKRALPIIKETIGNTSTQDGRTKLICQMIYSCKVNNDNEALLDTLIYFKNRHKNEQSWVYNRTMEALSSIYDLPYIGEKHWSVLRDIVQLFYVKDEYLENDILEAMMHFEVIHDLPIDKTIDMLLKTYDKYSYINLEFLAKFGCYEKRCLMACIDAISKKFESKTNKSSDSEAVLWNIIQAIYDLKDRCIKSRTTIEYLTIKDYPWLMTAIQAPINGTNECIRYRIKLILWEKEPELYKTMFPNDYDKYVTSSMMVTMLKQNPQSVLDNWKEYLEACKRFDHDKNVQRFVKATRWYKDIPIKFSEHCINDLQECTDKKPALTLLSILLHGDSLIKFITPLIPTETTIDIDHSNAEDNYQVIRHLPRIMKLSNPLISLDLLVKFCEGDFLSVILHALESINRRSPSPEMISFAQKLVDKRIGVRKHGIRLICLAAPKHEVNDFLLSKWQTEHNHSIREVLFQKAKDMFDKEPTALSWNLLSSFISTLTVKDKGPLSNLWNINDVPNQYIASYVYLLWDMIDNLSENRFDREKTTAYTKMLLDQITASVCNYLSEGFMEKLLRRFLFCDNDDLSQATRRFAIESYLLPAKTKLVARIKVFADVYEEVKDRRNVADPKIPYFYPVNYIIRKFVDELISTSHNPQIMENILEIFLSGLEPTMDPSSYLLLMYTRERKNSASPEEFGLRINHKMPDLIRVFSTLFISFMAETLNFYLQHDVFGHGFMNDDDKFRVIEGLIQNSNPDANFMAMKLLMSMSSKCHIKRRNQFIEKFRKMNHPAITAILYYELNKTDND